MNGDAVLSDRLKSISVCGSRDEVKGRETTERPSNCVRVSDQNGNVIDEPSDTKTEAALKCTKRDDYLSWDEYFMAVAMLSAQRSKDPNRQVGACVVNSENKIVGVGYNGLPIGCHDDDFPWGKKGGFLDTKYAYVCHAEMNAVVNSNTGNVRGCTIYVTLFPCNECTKLLIQSGIKEVVYGTDKYHDASQFVAARKMMSCANVIERRFQTSKKSVQLSLEFP